jgi:aspartyl-tRNA(Asn)/glutamyl-tRNA(Gln) amidotransferase subunit C
MQEIKQYEAMAKLDLPEHERRWIAEQMEHWKVRFKILQSIDTDNTEPLVSVLDLINITRDDIADKQFSREEILSNAPEQYNGYFQTPKTVEP